MLQQLQKINFIEGKVNQEKPTICFVFCDFDGDMNLEDVMELYRTSFIFRMSMEYCDNVWVKLGGASILKYFTVHYEKPSKIVKSELSTIYFAIQYCLVKLFESWGVKPGCVVGHILGRFAIAVASGLLSLEDAFKLLEGTDCLVETVLYNPNGRQIMPCRIGSLVKNSQSLTTDDLIKYIRNEVQGTPACSTPEDLEYDMAIEIGSKVSWNGLLSTLAELYIGGVEIEWEMFYRFRSKAKVDLPHYPFCRKSYWFERAVKNCCFDTMEEINQILGGLEPEGVNRRDNIPNVYEMQWEPSSLVKNTNDVIRSIAGDRNEWVVMCDMDNGCLTSLKSLFQKFNRKLAVIPYKRLLLEMLEENLQGYINALLEDRKQSLEGVLYFVKGQTVKLDGNWQMLLQSMLYVLQYLLQVKVTEELPRFHLVTKGVWNVGGKRGVNAFGPMLGTLWGFMRSARLELPGLASVSVDLDPNSDLLENCENLMNELWLDGTETEILYRQGVRHVRRLTQCILGTIPQIPGQVMFDEKSTYIITGGKGEIGLGFAQWMVSRGAKYLVLVGRSSGNDTALKVVAELEKCGLVVICKQVDISDYHQCKKMIEEIQQNPVFPPVGGVHHCGEVLAHEVGDTQDWSSFEQVLYPIVVGAYNLHLLTLECQLEFFVVYSSISATFGNFGQCNYSAANAYMDALVEYRHSMGLPGLTINWGRWDAENLEKQWGRRYSVEQGVKAMEYCMTTNKTSAVVGSIDFSTVLKKYPKYEHTLLEKLNISNIIMPCKVINHVDPIQQPEICKATLKDWYLQCASCEDRKSFLQKFVTEAVCETLGVTEQEVDLEMNFSEMGLDSLMFLELTNMLQVELGDAPLGFVDMEEDGTVKKIVEIIGKILS